MKKIIVVLSVLFVAVLTVLGLKYVQAQGFNGIALDFDDSGFPEFVRIDFDDSGFPEFVRIDFD
ncbi:MAG: hypothetical protein RBR75_04520, partial [Acholeplasmataceae bacterium]|nr:hypothetical protein [Acholeplasmataceae bacterium]